MDLILEHQGRTFVQGQISDRSEFTPPFGARPYVCLIWDADGALALAERQAVADAIIASNCRYVVCGGAQCEAWHDAMDEAFLAQNLEGEEYEERFVMTSWHAGEPVDEVAFFFVHCTVAEDEPDTKFLVLQVGGAWDTTERLQAAIRAEATHEEDDPDDEDV
jgi:hypothetical protein